MAITGGAVVGMKLLSAGQPLEFSADDRKRVAAMRAGYPEAASAIMPALWLAQERWGYISREAAGAVARELGVAETDVVAVASFYSMYNLKPAGKYVLQVCCTLSCSLAGAEALVEHLKRRLGVEVGETTADGRFTLRKVECLAACGNGPMLQVNEQKYHENLDLESVDRLLDALP